MRSITRLVAVAASIASLWASLSVVASATGNPIAALLRDAIASAPSAAGDLIAQIPTSVGDVLEHAAGNSGGGSRRTGRIVRVADGDTITIRTAEGTKSKVRLLGIDAPESSTLRRGHAECGGLQAKALMKALALEHPIVTLISDPSQDTTDRYGRRLAYVEPAGGGKSFQQRLLEAGWAHVYVFRPAHPPKRTNSFQQGANAARSAHRGVWKACGGSFTKPM